MRVSVVVPLAGDRPGVRRAHRSVVGQTYRELEILVVDDGTLARGAEAAAALGDARLRVVRAPGLGAGAACNAAVEAAGGEVVAFLDAGHEWLPGHVEQGVRLLTRYGPEVGAAVAGRITREGGAEAWRRRGIRDGALRLKPGTPPPLAEAHLAYMHPASVVVRREVFLGHGGFYDGPAPGGEDAYLWVKVLFNERVAFTLRPGARWFGDILADDLRSAEVPPYEPVLTALDELRAACPERLHALLEQVLAIRAFRTAYALGQEGRWREAAWLQRRHGRPGAWRLPYFLPGLACSSPLGGVLGRTLRSLGLTAPGASARGRGG